MVQSSGREEEGFSVSNEKELDVEITIASFRGDKSEKQALAFQRTEIGIKSCLWSFL